MKEVDANTQVLISSLMDQVKSRLDVIAEYIKADPRLVRNPEYQDKLYFMVQVTEKLRKL